MAQETGGGAFPVTGLSNRNGQMVDMVYQPGMSLRDYFAAKALQGLTSVQKDDGTWAYGDAEGVADEAYAIADAMLKARAK